jgi:hypothetical protein
MANTPAMTAELRQQILAGIRAGGYPYVAAEASGISQEDFAEWMRQSGLPGAEAPYKGFAEEVRQAHAQARLRAEAEAFQANPKVWLEHGPGRETPGKPGWAVGGKSAAQDVSEDKVLQQPELMRFLRELTEVLQGYPDAHPAVCEFCRGYGLPL